MLPICGKATTLLRRMNPLRLSAVIAGSVALALFLIPTLRPADAASQKTPQEFTMPEFRAVVLQGMAGSAAAFGEETGLTRDNFHPLEGPFFHTYVYSFAKGTIRLVSGGVSIMMVVDKLQSEGVTCVEDSFSRDFSGGRAIVLGANSYTCSKRGETFFLGFVQYINDSQKAGHLFWVMGTSGGITTAAGQSALDGIFTQLEKNYAR